MRRNTTHSIALSLALCAMVLRALLPSGWMPNAADTGTPFVICSVDAAPHGGKDPGDGQQRTHAPCAFAAAAPLSPPSTAATVVRNLGDVITVARHVRAAPFVSQSGYQANAARAPPAAA